MSRKAITWFITASFVAALLGGLAPGIRLGRKKRRARLPSTLPVARRHPRS